MRRVAASPSQVGHLDVHQHHVGLSTAGEVDGVASIAGLADHRDARLAVEDRAKAAAHECLVVGDQHRDGVLGALVWRLGAGHGQTVVPGDRGRVILGSQAEITLGDDGRHGARD
jgi:hypothetical protein